MERLNVLRLLKFVDRGRLFQGLLTRMFIKRQQAAKQEGGY